MTLRIRLRTCFLILTAIAATLAISGEMYRESVRADRLARAKFAWRMALDIHSMQRRVAEIADRKLGTDTYSKKANKELLDAAMRISESESSASTTPFSVRKLLLVAAAVATILGITFLRRARLAA